MRKLKRRKEKNKFSFEQVGNDTLKIKNGKYQYWLKFENNRIKITAGGGIDGLLHIQPNVSNSVYLLTMPLHKISEVYYG